MQNVKLVIIRKAFSVESQPSAFPVWWGPSEQIWTYPEVGPCMVKARGPGLWPRCPHIDTYMDMFNRVHFRPYLLWINQMDPSDSPLVRHLLSSGRKWATDCLIFYWLTGDEILTNTSPTLIKLNPDVDGFYLRVKGMNGQVTLADSYSKNAAGYIIIFGDGDMQTITIKDPSKQ